MPLRARGSWRVLVLAGAQLPGGAAPAGRRVCCVCGGLCGGLWAVTRLLRVLIHKPFRNLNNLMGDKSHRVENQSLPASQIFLGA